MILFRPQRARLLLAMCLTLVILFTQGLRVQIHTHDDLPLASHADVHTHIIDGWKWIDHEDNAGDIEISKLVLFKLLAFKQLLAITSLVLLFLVSLPARSFILLPRRMLYLFDPPYLIPPGHAPPY
jgi:hypothetical protein